VQVLVALGLLGHVKSAVMCRGMVTGREREVLGLLGHVNTKEIANEVKQQANSAICKPGRLICYYISVQIYVVQVCCCYNCWCCC
jgi:hypothetical protein